MSSNNLSFLGTGWSFPPNFNKNTRTVDLLSDEEDIASSLEVILSTSLGERVMRDDFGTDLAELLFEPIGETMKAYVESMLTDALDRYEPRVDVEELTLEDHSAEGRLEVHVDYFISATNSSENLVFPFYLTEPE